MTDREIALIVSSPTGGGEVWRAGWRWWQHRPRVAVGVEAPAPFGGTWGIDAAGERQTYQDGPGRVEETRGTARFHATDWTASALRWEASAGVDSVRGRGRGISVGAALEQRLLEDRLAVLGRGAVWSRTADAWSASLRAEWRSSARHEGTVWLARGGIALAGEAAPLALWPGAGAGQGRDLLLRAHPLLRKGIVSGGVFGRRLADAGVEWRGWRALARGVVRLAPAVFIDSARASRGLADSNHRWQFDAGAGLRLAVPGSGVVRLDLARGLRDGGFVLSAGWTR